VGLFGLLGGRNFGNEGSLEVMLTYLRTDHPDAILDAMCSGPERLRDEYGVEAIPMLWHEGRGQQTYGVRAIALKAVSKGVDTFRTASWVRKHDVVIVPGAGVLETTLPTRPWGLPYALFVLSASGRIFGTKVALVNVGASVINQRLTKWLLNSAARLAFYRSYRDILSRDAMQRRGLDTSHDHVYPDLVFGMPAPPDGPDDGQTVGVGLMAYHGGNDDRRSADEIYARYIEKMKCFVLWLVDSGHQIRLFGGDSRFDDSVVEELLADLRARRPNLERASVVVEPVSSLAGLMREIALVDTVVATRYHNVVCALRLSKPTVSIGYAAKHDILMADMGLSEFCQSVVSLDVDRLIEQFTDLESRASELKRTMAERNAAKAHDLEHQFAVLSSLLFPQSSRSVPQSKPRAANQSSASDALNTSIAPGGGAPNS